MYTRYLKLNEILERKSILLLGPRQTGKTTLISTLLSDATQINLLEGEFFNLLSAHPEKLREIVKASKTKKIVIDEIQKIPALLDEVHSLIEKDKTLRFLLTGSSARKLRIQGVNLLGGRARRLEMFPITYSEFLSHPTKRDPVSTLLQWGGIPSILESEEPIEDLKDYVGTYLKEEIQAEALVRSLQNFSRFLTIAATVNAEQVIYSNIASDSGLAASTVKEYFQILEDTLVGEQLLAFRATHKRKAMGSPKFYFFDVGVVNTLLGRFSLTQGSPEYGKCFEHLIWRELRSALGYLRSLAELSYWRSLSKLEVDFIISESGQKNPLYAIEVKAKKSISTKDFKALNAFSEEYPQVRKMIICHEPIRRNTENSVEIWPVEDFLKALWNREFF